MKCPNCNEENPEGMKFCSLCGSVLTVSAAAAQPSSARTRISMPSLNDALQELRESAGMSGIAATLATQTSSSQNNYEWYTDVSEAEMYDLKQNLLEDKDCCYHNNASGEWDTKFVFTFPADNSPEVKTAMEKVLKFVTETKTASKGYELQFWPGDEPKIYGNRIIFNFKELEVQDEIPYDDKAFSDVKIPFSISILETLGIDSVKEFAHLFARRSSNSDFECVQYCNMYVPLHQEEGYINDEGDYVIDISGDFDGSSCTRVFYDPDTMDLVLFYYIRIEDLNKKKIPVTQTGVYQYNFERERIYGAGPVTFVERLGNDPTNIEDICDIREMKYLLVDKEDVVKEGNKFFLSRSSLKKYVEIADKTGRLNEELRNYFK